MRYGKRIIILLAAVLCCLLWVSAAEVLPASNGYYSIEFDVDSTHEAFVTGLTADSFTVVQNTVRAACNNGTSPTVTNSAFIDAEKVADYINLNGQPDYDTELCWAASSSNVLHYTGWGEKAGFDEADRMLEEFITRFDNVPGRADYALKWFFNGWNKMQTTANWAHQDDGEYDGFMGYLPAYAFESLSETIELEDHKDNMETVAARLKAGYGTALYTGYHNAVGERDGGHGLTLWGYVREKNGAFTYLIYSDSDNDYAYGGDRRAAPNRLHICKLQQYTGKGEDSWAVAYNAETGMWQVVESVFAVCPYDDAITADTDGTHNAKAQQDLTAQRILIDTVIPSYYVPAADEVWQRNVFTTNDDLVFQVQVGNASDVAPTDCAYKLEFWRNGTYMGYISNSSTQIVWGAEQTGAAVLEANYSQLTGALNFGTSFSAAGQYEVKLTVNPTQAVSEAYYENNTVTRTFTVVSGAAAGTVDAELAAMGMQDDGTYGGNATIGQPANGERYYLFITYGKRVKNSTTQEYVLQRLPWYLLYAGSEFPDEMFIERNETTSLVIFRLLVQPADETQPYGEYFSSELTQAYRRITLTSEYTDSENVYYLTSVREGATEYAEGEKSTYNVVNRSTVDGDEDDGRLKVTFHLRAYRASNGECYHLGNPLSANMAINGTFKSSVANTTLSNRSLVDVYTHQVLPADDYAIYAEAEFVNAAGQPEVARAQVGEITILPQNARVTTEDATEIESTSALLNVSAVADLDQAIRLGVEYFSGDEITTLWLDDAPMLNGSVNVYRETRLEGLTPGVTYYYCAVMQIEGEGTVYGDLKQFTTPHNDLVLDEPLQFHVSPNGSTCYFTPDADGWYLVNVTGGDCTAELLDGAGAEMETFTSSDGVIAENCYLTAGVTYVLNLTAQETALCTVTVSASGSSVTEAWVEVTSLTQTGQHSYSAEITAHVPLDSTFSLGMKMESDFWYATIVSDSFTNWTKDTATARVTISASQLDVIRYKPYIQIGGEERYGEEQTIVELPVMNTLASGMCGEKVSWLLTEDGTLMIAGIGAMDGSLADAIAPYKDGVTTVIVGNGVTGVGAGAFASCTALERVMLGESVTVIGEGAFDGCAALSGIAYGGTEAQWGEIEIGEGNDKVLYAWKCFEWTLPHDHNHMETVTPATCTTAGYTMATCWICGDTTAVDVDTPALGHDLTHHAGKAPTCLEGGWSEYDTCSRCGYTTYTELAPLGHDLVHHDAKAPTCTEIGWEAYDTCSRCDYTTYVELAPLGHDMVHHDAKEPTCTEIGWYAYDACSRCDESSYIGRPALGHNLVRRDAKAATCTEIGWNTHYRCSRCGYSPNYVEIPMTEHSLVHHDAKEPTYTEVGWCEYDACENCDYSTKVEIAPLDFAVMEIDFASRSGVTVAAKDSVAHVVVAVYDAQGKVLAVYMGTPFGGVWKITAALPSNAASVKAFALDEAYRPLCEVRSKNLS